MGIKYNEKDYTGQRYGMLVAVCYTGEKQTSPSGKSKRIWLLRCDCGREIKRTTQSLCNWARLPANERTHAHCGCRQKHGTESVALEIFQSEYSDGDISFEKFLELSQRDCHHCGSKVQDTGSTKIRRASKRSEGRRTTRNNPVTATFQYHGLDRIDNNKGHTLDNVVPCCAPCNYLRGKRDIDQFLGHLNKIISNYRKRNETRLTVNRD